MDSPEHQQRRVIEYLGGQAPDETVEHPEKIASERVYGTQYDVWDVHTDKDRWWVVEPPTNLYTQRDFRSMDGVLSFHIGVTARVMSRQWRQAPNTPEPRLQRTRRQWQQAAEAQNEADEAEEFQAVGVRCREVLVSFAQAMGTDDLIPDGETPPKASDFIQWSERIADAVAPGSSAARLRSYLKATAKAAWEYVSWLTHAKNAVRSDGDMAVEVTAHVLSLFEQAIERRERGGPDRCPSCGSYRVVGESPLPKTASSRRINHLPSFALDALRQHRLRQLQERLRAGDRWQDHDLVFSSSVGTPIETRNLTRHLHRLCKVAGLKPERFHNLRHTAASIGFAEGLDPKMIQHMLGHSAIGVTMDTYTHLVPGLQKEAAERIGKAIGG